MTKKLKEIEKYRAQMIEAIRSLDLDYAKSRFPKASSEETLLAGMHKARSELAEATTQERYDSVQWLKIHGYKGLNGKEL